MNVSGWGPAIGEVSFGESANHRQIRYVPAVDWIVVACSVNAPFTSSSSIRLLPESASYVCAHGAPPLSRIFANTFSGASLEPVTVTVAFSPGVGVMGLTVAVIAPFGARNVMACVIGVVIVVPLLANQIQNTSVPGGSQVKTFWKLKSPFTSSPYAQ